MAETYLLTFDRRRRQEDEANLDIFTTHNKSLLALTFISCVGEINCLWEIQFPFPNRTHSTSHLNPNLPKVHFIHPPAVLRLIIHQSIAELCGQIVGTSPNDAVELGDRTSCRTSLA